MFQIQDFAPKLLSYSEERCKLLEVGSVSFSTDEENVGNNLFVSQLSSPSLRRMSQRRLILARPPPPRLVLPCPRLAATVGTTADLQLSFSLGCRRRPSGRRTSRGKGASHSHLQVNYVGDLLSCFRPRSQGRGVNVLPEQSLWCDTELGSRKASKGFDKEEL